MYIWRRLELDWNQQLLHLIALQCNPMFLNGLAIASSQSVLLSWSSPPSCWLLLVVNFHSYKYLYPFGFPFTTYYLLLCSSTTVHVFLALVMQFSCTLQCFFSSLCTCWGMQDVRWDVSERHARCEIAMHIGDPPCCLLLGLPIKMHSWRAQQIGLSSWKKDDFSACKNEHLRGKNWE